MGNAVHARQLRCCTKVCTQRSAAVCSLMLAPPCKPAAPDLNEIALMKCIEQPALWVCHQLLDEARPGTEAQLHDCMSGSPVAHRCGHGSTARRMPAALWRLVACQGPGPARQPASAPARGAGRRSQAGPYDQTPAGSAAMREAVPSLHAAGSLLVGRPLQETHTSSYCTGCRMLQAPCLPTPQLQLVHRGSHGARRISCSATSSRAAMQ